MPVGAGGEALRRIEVALAGDDPARVDSFDRWREPPGRHPGCDGSRVGVWTGMGLLLGLLAVALELAGALVMMVLGAILVFGMPAARWACEDPASPHRLPESRR